MTDKELGLPETMELHCLFCNGTQFKAKNDKPPQSGDLVECSACGQLNDFDAMLDVCKEEVAGLAKTAIERQIKDAFKKMLK
jgi:hypothetical protein